MKCVCTKCPVQDGSQCVKDKLAMAPAAFMKQPLNGTDIPGMYCSTGKATCTDINTAKTCICGTCPLWAEYSLVKGTPKGYYCRDGATR